MEECAEPTELLRCLPLIRHPRERTSECRHVRAHFEVCGLTECFESHDATQSLADGDRSDGDGGRADSEARCSSRAVDCGICMYVHANGVGQDFFDCTPVGTYNSAQAMAACEAYTGKSTECRSATCGAASVVCSSGETTSCACWGFAGA